MGIFDTYHKKPKRNLFPLSFNWFGSIQDFGVLYPIMCKPAVPGDVFKHGHAVNLQFMPMTANVNSRIRVCTYYFFVPNRILWPDWDKFISRNPNEGMTWTHPYIDMESVYNDYDADHKPFGFCHGSLADYLNITSWHKDDVGYSYAWTQASAGENRINSLPFRAYQKIFNDYFRDEQSTTTVLYDDFSGEGDERLMKDSEYGYRPLMALRVKAWNKDPFTTSLVYRTAGNYVPTVGANFTIEDLRNANSITKFFERINSSGTRPQEFIRAVWGVTPKDYRLDMPEFLSGSSSQIVFGQIYNSEASTGEDAQAQGYSVSTARSSSIAGGWKYRARENGWYIGLMCLVPDAVYFRGIPRYMQDFATNTDYPMPDFAHIGDEAVRMSQLKWRVPQTAQDIQDNKNVFAYAPRYWEYKYFPNEIHGLFRDAAFHDYSQKRSFDFYEPNRQGDFAYIQGEPQGWIDDPWDGRDKDKLKYIFNINKNVPIAYANVFHQIKGLRPFPYDSTPRL